MAMQQPENLEPDKVTPRADDEPWWEYIVRLGQELPDEAAAKLPRDLAENLDKYLDE